MAITEIERIVQQRLPICSAIQYNRQHCFRVNSCGGSIDHQFAYGDVNAVRPPVADTENSFRVCSNDKSDMSSACGMPKRIFNLLRSINRQKCRPLRIDKLFAVLLDTFRDNRIINNRHQLHNVFMKYIIEKCSVVIEDIHKKSSFFYSGILSFHLAVNSVGLRFNIVNTRR